jgi:hypothetical protein
VAKGIGGTEIPPITRDHYRKADLNKIVRSAYPVLPGLSHMTNLTGFDTRADRHTRHTARLGGLDDFLAFDFCVFHDLIPPILSLGLVL